MRIAILTTHLPPIMGGIEVHCWNLGKCLASRGHDVTLYGSLEADRDNAKRVEHPFHNLTVKRIAAVHTPLLRRLSRFMCLDSAFREDHAARPFSVIHAHQIWPVGLAGAALAGDDRVRLIITEHGSVLADRGRFLARWSMRWACARASGIVTASSELAEVVAEVGVPPEKITSIPNAIWPDDFQVREDKTEVRRRLGFPEKEFVAMTVRRLVPKNGVQYAVQAATLLSTVVPNFVLAIVGDGPLRHDLERSVVAAGIGDHVRFLGPVDNQDVKYYMRAADLGVFPSLAEATSIAALEFMAAGTPVAASTVGGLPEIIDDGETGFLFDIGFTKSRYDDPGLSSQAIDNIAATVIRASHSDLKTIGRQAAETVKKRFSWESYAERLERGLYGVT